MTKEFLIQKTRDTGLKLTHQRLAIVDVLTEKNLLHPSARLIYKEANMKTRFWITDTRLEYYRYCEKCKKKLSRQATKSI